MNTQTRCIICDGPMRHTLISHPFDALPGICLDGVSRYECEGCGEVEIGIPAMESLIQTLTRALVERETPLTGAELRFLRKTLGWSGVDTAAYMGVTKETISRWESGKAPLSALADRLIRMYVVQGAALRDYDLHHMRQIAQAAAPAPLHLAHKEAAWHHSAP